MSAYLTVAEFRTRTVMPASSVDELEVREPGFLDATLSDCSAWIDARLAKRYSAPFSAPYPVVLLPWLTWIVTPVAYAKLGSQPSAVLDKENIDAANRARAEIKEAADSKDGLFELPLRADTTAQGVSRGGPLSYSETSPYRCVDLQAEEAALEDR